MHGCHFERRRGQPDCPMHPLCPSQIPIKERRCCMPRLSSESGAHSFSAFKCPAQMQRQIELKGNVTLSLSLSFCKFGSANQPMRHLGRWPLLFSITIRVVICRFHRIRRRNIARSDNLSGLLLKYDLNEMRFLVRN